MVRFSMLDPGTMKSRFTTGDEGAAEAEAAAAVLTGWIAMPNWPSNEPEQPEGAVADGAIADVTA